MIRVSFFLGMSITLVACETEPDSRSQSQNNASVSIRVDGFVESEGIT